jgi:agmatinase
MDNDLEKMAAQCRTFTKEMVDNPYRGLATFFGLPYTESLDNLDIALIGVPIDLGVTDRSGTRMGPRALRNESRGVGAYNHCTRSTPCTAHRIADVGDVPFRSVYRIEEALDDISAYYRGIAAAGVTPVTAGGDHSITFPILQGLAPKEKVCLVHFDSHCDTAPPIHGCGYTHGSPMKNAVEAGLVDAEHSLQIGIRGSSEPLWEFSSASGMRVIHIEEFYEMGWKGAVKEIHDLVGDSPVYLSFDIDCLDPAFAPGTGTPVAGGMSTVEALQMVRGMQGLDVIGGDLVEVSPPYDHAGITALAGATLLFEILCRAAEARERRGA